MCYYGVVAVGLMVSAFVVSGMVVRLVVEEPEMVTEELNNDYTRERESPTAFVPIISCERLGSVGQSRNNEIRGLYCLVLNYKTRSGYHKKIAACTYVFEDVHIYSSEFDEKMQRAHMFLEGYSYVPTNLMRK
ncbi:adipose-regulatory protein, seipin [Tanacetum coccineum]